jgi:hypothetical protein
MPDLALIIIAVGYLIAIVFWPMGEPGEQHRD